MIFAVELKYLPFEPEPSEIIYVAGEGHDDVTEVVRQNFDHIRDILDSHDYTFSFLPHVKEDLLSGERLHYNAPFAKSPEDAEDMVNDNFILDYMAHPENREKVAPALLFFSPKCRQKYYREGVVTMQGITISKQTLLDDGELNAMLDEFDNAVCFSISYHRAEESIAEVAEENDGKLLRPGDDDKVCEKVAGKPRIEKMKGWFHKYLEDDEKDADDAFDWESRKLMNEIEERIEKLQQKGIESYIIEQMFKNHKRRLSRLLVTKDYRIVLPDYFGMEIQLYPIDKAVYLLFLRHPEGIPFKCLGDYREELSELYKRMNDGDITDAMRRSIERVTDPFDNSINEKCSHIRAAFISKFDEHLARNYFISGKRGEPKRILLPWDMVKWEID